MSKIVELWKKLVSFFSGNSEIKIGDEVISFDFPDSPRGGRDIEGDNACYFQGKVEEIGRFPEFQPSCDMYKVKTTKRVFGGEEKESDEYFFVPVNGTNKMGGGVTDGVVKV